MRITNFSFTKIDAFTLKNSLIKLEIAQTIHPAHPLPTLSESQDVCSTGRSGSPATPSSMHGSRDLA